MKHIFSIILLLSGHLCLSQNSTTDKETSRENYILKIISDLNKEEKVTGNPVIVINERIINAEALDTMTISAFEIESLSIIEKNQKTFKEIYGEQSINGVILIERKPFKEKINKDYNINEDVLFLLEGKPIKGSEANKIEPDDIEHIMVIKNKDSISKYTSGKVQGVVKIKLKKKN